MRLARVLTLPTLQAERQTRERRTQQAISTWLGSSRRFLEECDQFSDRVMAVVRVAQWALAMDFVPVPPPIACLCEVASLLEIADDAGRAPLCYPDGCGDVPNARPRICGDAREDVCVVRYESPCMEVIAGIYVHESVLWYST